MYKQKESKPSSAQWERLYSLSHDIYQMKPWTWMCDNDFFALTDPNSADYLYVSVMGNSGQHLAIGAYIGAKGFAGLDTLFRMGEISEHPSDFRTADMLNTQTCIQVSFYPPHNVDVDEVRRAAEYGWPETEVFPEFRSFIPGFAPWYISKEEAAQLIATLEQTIDVALRFKDNRNLFDTVADDRIFARVRQSSDPNHVWTDSDILLPPVQSPVDMLDIEVSAKAQEYITLLSDFSVTESTWECGIFFASTPIDGRPYILRPYFPKILLLIDHETNFVYGMRVLDRTTHGEQIATLLVGSCQKAGGIPKTILVADASCEMVLRELLQSTSIKVELCFDLPALDEVITHMDEYMDGI